MIKYLSKVYLHEVYIKQSVTINYQFELKTVSDQKHPSTVNNKQYTMQNTNTTGRMLMWDVEEKDKTTTNIKQG